MGSLSVRSANFQLSGFILVWKGRRNLSHRNNFSSAAHAISRCRIGYGRVLFFRELAVNYLARSLDVSLSEEVALSLSDTRGGRELLLKLIGKTFP